MVIALAVRALPRHQRGRVIALGAGAAVVLRVALTFFAARLLTVRFVQLGAPGIRALQSVDRVRSEYTNTIFTSTSGKTAGPT